MRRLSEFYWKFIRNIGSVRSYIESQMMLFSPNFTITPSLTNTLMDIEASRQAISILPITLTVLTSLRESARLTATHYSTQIEGNCLTQEQVNDVIQDEHH